MVEDFIGTAWRLWGTARWWRYSALACVAAAAWWAVVPAHHDVLPPGPRNPPPAAPPSGRSPAGTVSADPLKNFIDTYGRLTDPNGQRMDRGSFCETLNAAFQAINPSDGRLRDRGTAARSAAVGCGGELASSDGRLAQLSNAVAAVDARLSRQTIDALADADKQLAAFDRSRPSAKPELDKAQADLAASDGRIAEFLTAVADYRQAPPSAASYQRVADALQKVDPDRGRTTSADKKDALMVADGVVAQIRASADHFRGLAQALDQAKSVQDVPPALVGAVAAITSFDRAAATDQQKQMLADAGQRIAPVVWQRLEQQQARLLPDSPAGYPEAVASYRLAASLPATTLTEDHRRALEQGSEAEQKLVNSDTRLEALLKAAAAWQTDGVAGGDVLLGALRDVTATLAFDRPRFQSPQQQAWRTLTEADSVLHASHIDAAMKATLPVCVAPAAAGARAARIAAQITDGLRSAGFHAGDDCKHAALQATVGYLGSVATAHRSPTSGLVESQTTASIGIGGRWASGTPLPQETVVGQSDSGEASQAEGQAVDDAIQKAVAKLTAMTER